MSSEELPKTSKVLVGRSILTDDTTLPSSIVVDVDHDISPGSQSGLDEVVVLLKKGSIQRGGGFVVAD